jgi:hypothetical protein
VNRHIIGHAHRVPAASRPRLPDRQAPNDAARDRQIWRGAGSFPRAGADRTGTRLPPHGESSIWAHGPSRVAGGSSGWRSVRMLPEGGHSDRYREQGACAVVASARSSE